MKILLTSVFGPFGVDDQYGVKESKMELFHNQVTREQGVFSMRSNHNSQNLFFLAENINMPATVLDFPNLKRFKKELAKNYQYVGITFIASNFKKAKKMAELVRTHAPNTKIILGGHGTKIDNIEELVPHDYICKGEGVRFLRELFGEDVDAPIKHPLVYSAFNRRIMGVPLKEDSGILTTGVGCANKCRFCSTTHYFGDYFAFLKTGQEIFDLCCRYQDELKVTDFGVLDENFLKMPTRALELLDCMEKNNRFFKFAIFSSAETIRALGDLDILTRLGIYFIWIGVESQKEVYLKNKGTDFKILFEELRQRGISVLASSIMFLEHHDKQTVWDDVNYAISLNPDYLQFMQLGPVPGTPLYFQYKAEGKLLADVPWELQHGQDKIWFSHPHFSSLESQQFLKQAFVLDYQTNGASLIRAIRTNLLGLRYLKSKDHPTLKIRATERALFLKEIRYMLLAASIFQENKATKRLLKEVRQLFKELLGPLPFKGYLLSLAVAGFAAKEWLRIKFVGDNINPKLFYVKKNFKKLDNPKVFELPKKLTEPLASS